MKTVWFKVVPFDKTLVTLALESGVDGLIVEEGDREAVLALGRTEVLTPEELTTVTLTEKADEEAATAALKAGETVVLTEGWEIIPVENILAQAPNLLVEAKDADRAELAAGILQTGVAGVVVDGANASELKEIVKRVKLSQGTLTLTPAKITKIEPVGLGHRVCVDTLSVLKTGQGMLTGNSSAFTFLVNAETESNPYVAARPFRINAGAVHAYAAMPGDKTTYLEEIGAGDVVLIVAADGSTSLATVGRAKVEIRPMLLIEAETKDGTTGAAFLQNAETIRLVGADGTPISVVSLQVGDEVLTRTDTAGRHFGMRISEDIKEG